MYPINKDSIEFLREKFKDDVTTMQVRQDCIQSFMEYSSRIYQLETYRLLFNYDNKNREDFQQELTNQVCFAPYHILKYQCLGLRK
jgi:hypothetical protein